MSAGTTDQTAGEGRARRGDPGRRSPRIDPREVAHAHRLVEAISRTFDSKVVGQEALRTALLVGLIGGERSAARVEHLGADNVAG